MDQFGSPSRRLVMKLSISVQLTDDLTGLPVKGSNARVWIDGQKPPIVKPDGRYIFVDVPEGEYTVNAEGGLYCRIGIRCTVTADKAENVTLRMLPNKQYPMPSDSVLVEGKAAPGAALRIFPDDRSTAYKLLSGAEKGSRVVGIYHGEGINIEGKLLKIIAPDNSGEYIRIAAAEDGDRSEYRLDGELVSDYPKIGTVIVPVSECTADGNGGFMLMLRTGTGSGSSMTCEVIDGDKVITKKLDIGGSNYIKADFSE